MKLKIFDYLGSVFGFTYDESMRLQTNCGGILSIMLTLLSIIIISTMGTALFDKSNPVLIQQTGKYAHPLQINFNPKFNIAVRMTNDYVNVYNNLDKVRVRLVQNIVYKSHYKNQTLINIPMTICDESKFPFQKDYFNQFFLNESLCPVMDGMSIYGDFLIEYFSFFQVQFYMCQNDPITGKSNDGEDIVCKNETEIQDYMNNNLIKAHLFFSDTSYNTSNYENPDRSYLNNYNMNLFFNTLRETNFYLYYNNLTSDNTAIFFTNSTRSWVNIAFSQVSERSAVRDSQMMNFVLINIQADKFSNSIGRSYTGFAQLAASIGAIVNIVFLFFNCSVFLYSRIEFFNRLVKNSTYMHYKRNSIGFVVKTIKIENRQEKITDIPKKEEEESKVNIITNLNITETENKCIEKTVLKPEVAQLYNQSHLTKISNNQSQGILKANETLKEKFDEFTLFKYNHDKNYIEMLIISFCPFVKFCNSKLGRDIKFMDYSMKHYYKYTDFFRFFDSFIELNIMKKLLLNKEESEVLNTLKRIVFVKNNDLSGPIKECKEIMMKDQKDKLKSQGSLEISEEKLRKYINTIISKQNKSVFEQNIIDHFYENIKD